jgi:polyhydroxybutyrate depolymerase
MLRVVARNPASPYGGDSRSAWLFGLIGLAVLAAAVFGFRATATDGDSADAATSGDAAASPAAAENVSAGCSTTSEEIQAGQAYDATIEDQGVSRSYRFTPPADYAPDTPTQVILLFHGTGGTIDDIEEYTGLVAEANARGFAVLTPQGLSRTTDAGQLPAAWNVPGFETPADDVAFVEALLDEVGGLACLNLNGIYATGISAGGAFPAWLACNSDVVAGIAPIAGANLIRPCPEGRPVAYIGFHGTADFFVSYEGIAESPGDGDFYNGPALEVAASWAERAGCGDFAETQTPPDVTLRDWDGCSGADVQQYTVAEGGHTWPGAAAAAREECCGSTTATIDANALMLDFFAANPRQG